MTPFVFTPAIIAGTGHRPPKTGGYSPKAMSKVRDIAHEWLADHKSKINYVISGMALGWDQELAAACMEVGIPFHAYIPFEGQESTWPVASKLRFNALRSKAARVVICSPGGYAVDKMQKRNCMMVDASHIMLALWDGTKGGTGNCIQYAESVNRPIINLWSVFQNSKP